MKRFILLLAVASPLMMSCASHQPYKAVRGVEDVEYSNAKLNVYPDDVRANLDKYTNSLVAWAGVICSTDVQDPDQYGKRTAITTFQHHYFDWQQQGSGRYSKYGLSPRGEGVFRVQWLITPKVPSVTIPEIEQFAAPGKMVIVYGTPEKVDGNVVVLKYRFMRVVDSTGAFNVNEFDYGRAGEAVQYIGK